MRRLLLGLVVLGVSSVGTDALAQVPFSNVNDPFFLYYGFYLPRQAAQSMQSGPEATISAVTAARQSYASTNRSDMFDPNGVGFGRFDLDNDFLSSSGARPRGAGGGVMQSARHGGNLNGRGVSSGAVNRFNRVGSYHPTLRTGQGRNANVAVVRGRAGGLSAGAGMGAAAAVPAAGYGGSPR